MRPIPLNPVLPTRVAEEIRTAILDGVLAPGVRVKQEELAATLGVSREPVRQALLLLQREGLVHAAPNRSAVVAPLDRRLIADIYDFREAVEGLVAASLARRTDVDLEPLEATIARGRAAVDAGDFKALIDLDMAFHTALYEAAGNRVVVDVMRGHWSHMRRIMAMVLKEAGYRRHVWEEHAAIVEMIRSRRAGSARAVAGHHTRAAKQMLLSRIDGGDRASPG